MNSVDIPQEIMAHIFELFYCIHILSQTFYDFDNCVILCLQKFFLFQVIVANGVRNKTSGTLNIYYSHPNVTLCFHEIQHRLKLNFGVVVEYGE